MIEYEYYHDQYRRVPRNSANIQRELLEYNSTASASAFNAWSSSSKRPMTTKYIDGSSLLGLHERPCSMKGLFPKGKGLRKPSARSEKKINTGDTYISLLPAERSAPNAVTVRSEKNRSPLSMTTGTQRSTLPDAQRKSTDSRHNRIYSATIVDDEKSNAKFYGRCATTHANGAWVRRYKSINESQTLTDILRDQACQEKLLSHRQTCQQLYLMSSTSKSSFTSSFIKHRLTQC